MKSILTIAALVLATAVPADAFRAVNGLAVEQTGEHEFHVAFASTSVKTDYLCAAADFAARGLGLSGATRLYRESPAPRRSGEGVTFTLDQSRKVPMKMFTWIWVDDTDGGISVASARSNYCLASWPNRR